MKEDLTMENKYSDALSLQYASLGRRILALILDSLILCIPLAIGAHVIPVLGAAIVWFFYAPILESSEIRATLGKHLCGIQVTDLSGRRLSFRASLIRNLLKVVSGILLCIGFFFALFSHKKQALHDMLADSIVVYGRNDSSILDSWTTNVKSVFHSDSGNVGPAPLKQDSRLSELERLQILREKGTLTEEEFQDAKRKILQ
jgi:uncharacterized RDD family membrane protein YckC